MTSKETGANLGVLYDSFDVTHGAQGQKEAAFVQVRTTLQQNSEDTQSGKYLAKPSSKGCAVTLPLDTPFRPFSTPPALGSSPLCSNSY